MKSTAHTPEWQSVPRDVWQRVRDLGFKNYADYLASPHWQEFSRRYRAGDNPRTCRCCGARRVQLHHLTYDRLGQEEFVDVAPLCGDCHPYVHATHEARGIPLIDLGAAVAVLRPMDAAERRALLKSLTARRESRAKPEKKAGCCAEDRKKVEDPCPTERRRRQASPRKVSLPPALEEMVARCVTRGLENRGKGLLALARRVAGMSPRPPENLLRLVISEWNSRCVPPADARRLRGLYSQFRLALGRVKFPTGTAFARLLQAAREADPPLCAEPFRFDPTKVLLVKLCRVLGENAGGGPFPLSHRQAGSALGGYSRRQGARLLRELAAAGIIELVKAGRQGPGLQPGTTWRYLGG